MIDTVKAMEMYCRLNVTLVSDRVYIEKLPDAPVMDTKRNKPFPALVLFQTGGIEERSYPVVQPLYTLTAYGRDPAECMSIYAQFWNTTRTAGGGPLPPRRVNNRWTLHNIEIASQPSQATEESTQWPIVQFAVSARWDSVQGA